MNKSSKLLFALSLAIIPSLASAQCFGTGSLRTCSDSSGNTYNIQQYGNTTNMNGYNAGTGSRWSQNSSTYGNTTITNGRAANGNTWNSTTTHSGNSTFTTGRDSNGRFFSQTCTQYGCY